MINQVNIIGRLTRDVERKTYVDKSGIERSIAKFSIAVSERGENAETYFFDCVSFNVLADNIIKYCQKGSLVAISGNLKQEKYEDKTGQMRNKVYIRVNECEFLTPRQYETPTQIVYQHPQPTQQYYFQQPQYQQTTQITPNSALEALGLKPRSIEDEVGF